VLGVLLEIRWTDVVDVIVATMLVYTGVVLIRRTRAALVAIGILVLSGVAVGASALGLQLTAWMLQGFFAIFVIIVVVIFQEELRQLFERLAMWSLGRRGRRSARTDTTDVLVRCVTELAQGHIGALIVLPGSQPIYRHIHGGIELDGQVSVPLIRSVFDPHSPGHDGAMIVERDRIARFAAHLPLSTDFLQLVGVGTRHSAALGLAELTDALCVVVSEERGQISVAKDGRLRLLADPLELGAVLRQFLQPLPPVRRPRQVLRQLVRQNGLEKVASLLIVIGLWGLFVPGSRPTSGAYEVRVNVLNLPPDYVVEDVAPDTVKVSLTGPTRAFFLLDAHRVRVSVDAAAVKHGRRTFQITEENVAYPSDLRLVDVRPSQIRLVVRETANTPAATGLEQRR
jgi:diadenylate cyclase